MNTTRYYADKNGGYIGAFKGCKPDSYFAEVPTAPSNGLDKWDGKKWISAPLASVQVRDKALLAIDTYDFEDGRVIQIRIKEDRDNLKGGIKKGQTVWKMEDNKVYSVTTADLQAALDDQESQIADIWATHFADLEMGVTNKKKKKATTW